MDRGDVIYWTSTTTLGQLYNFFNVLGSMIMFVNCVLDINYRLREQVHLEDNLGIVADVMSSVGAMFVAYYSLNTPFDTTRVTTRVTQRFRTVVYLICLHMASQGSVLDDPTLIFSTQYELIGDLTSTVSPLEEDLSFTRSLGMGELVAINRIVINVIYGTKIWLTVSASIYSLYVVAASSKKYMRLIYMWTFLCRLPSVACAVFLLLIYIPTIDLRSVRRNSTYLYADFDANQATASAAFEAVGVVVLTMKSIYVTLIWRRYDFGLLAMVFICLKVLERQDELRQDGPLFRTLVYVLFATASMAVGPLLVSLTHLNPIKSINVGHRTLYKLGIVLVLSSSFFMVAAITGDWFEFDFQQGKLGDDAEQKINSALGRVDAIGEKFVTFARKLDPCVVRRDVPDDVAVVGDQEIYAMNNEEQVDAQLRRGRERIVTQQTAGAAGAVCIDTSSDNFDWVTDQTDSEERLRCEKLQDTEDEQREKLLKSVINNPHNALSKPYGMVESDFDNDNFVDEQCRNTQCNIMTGAALAALVIANIPFFGGVGMAMSLASRAAFTVFKIGRKLLKFGPKIRRKRDKILKLLKLVSKAVGVSTGAIGFTMGTISLLLPVFLGTVVVMAIVMFRRDVYTYTNGGGSPPEEGEEEEEEEEIVKAAPGPRPLGLVLGIFLPLLFIDVGFAVMLYIIPMFMEEFFGLLDEVLVKVTFDELPAYTSLKYAFISASLGNSIIVVSYVLHKFDETLVDGLMVLWTFLWRSVRGMFGSGSSRRKVTDIEETQTLINAAAKADPPKITFFKIINPFINLNTVYLQPMLFSLPAVAIILIVFLGNDKPYMKISTSASVETMQMNDALLETVSQSERTESIGQETDTQECGVVGKLVNVIINAVLVDLNTDLLDFTNIVNTVLSEAKGFVGKLALLVESPFTPLSIGIPGDFMGETVVNVLIYAVPIVCTGAYTGLWLASIFMPIDKRILTYIGMMVTVGSVANLFVHGVVASMMQNLSEFNMPYVKLNIEMSTDHYWTQLCSLCNLASVIVSAINVVVEIPVYRLGAKGYDI